MNATKCHLQYYSFAKPFFEIHWWLKALNNSKHMKSTCSSSQISFLLLELQFELLNEECLQKARRLIHTIYHNSSLFKIKSVIFSSAGHDFLKHNSGTISTLWNTNTTETSKIVSFRRALKTRNRKMENGISISHKEIITWAEGAHLLKMHILVHSSRNTD